MFLLITISTFFVTIPVATGMFFRVDKQKLLSPIFYLQCVALIIEIFNYILVLLNKNNMIIFNLFTLIEFTYIVFFFKNFFDQFFKTKLHYIIILIFIGVTIFTGFISDAFNLMDNLSVSLESIILIIYSLTAFFIIMKSLKYDNLLETPFFWINVAILLYFAGNMFFFAFSNYVQKHNYRELFPQLTIIHSTFNILYYLTITIGFWKARKV